VVSTAFIRDFLIGKADIASFSCYSKPPASAGGAFTLLNDIDQRRYCGVPLVNGDAGCEACLAQPFMRSSFGEDFSITA
jgi:hypothetical protein